MKDYLHLSYPHNQRLQRIQAPTYERLQARLAEDHSEPTEKPLNIHCGRGRLLIGQTYPDAEEPARDLLQRASDERDIALHVVTLQQVLTRVLQQPFLSPSDTLRLQFTDYRPARRSPCGFHIRRVHTEEDWAVISRLYLARSMLPVQTERLSPRHQGGPIHWLAEDTDTGVMIGTMTDLNHAKTFQDPKDGPNLWCLAVDPQCSWPGVDKALVRRLAERFMSRELTYLDFSVLHNNQQAKVLYRKLGFRELATFAIKRKSGVNQPLFPGSGPKEDLNLYARIIVDETHRCSIKVRVDGTEGSLFTLTQGGRQIRCRGSLSNLTTAVSVALRQDKVPTHRVPQHAGLRQPQQHLAGSTGENAALLAKHGPLVVKPMDDEQGQGVAMDLRTAEEVEGVIRVVRHFDSRVLLGSYHTGHDLRVLVTGYEVVTAAIRRPAAVIGDGRRSAHEPAEAQSHRRQAAIGGENRIPLDHETERILRAAGYGYDDVLPSGEHLATRCTANLHTGGIPKDVIDILHPTLHEVAIQATRVLEIPVAGLDLLVEAIDQLDYMIAEANEHADLVNHEPQPTAERFVDPLFPPSREVSSWPLCYNRTSATCNGCCWRCSSFPALPVSPIPSCAMSPSSSTNLACSSR